MARSLASIVALVLLLAMAACDPAPRVFAPGADSALTDVPAAAGVVVGAVTGLAPPVGDELRQAIAGALQSQGIPATTTVGTRASITLHGFADAAPSAAGRNGPAYLTWMLIGARGEKLKSFPGTARLRPGRIAQDNSGAIANIVGQVNEVLVGTDRRPVPQPAADPSTAVPAVSILPVEGAPGDGREVLARALSIALRNRGIRVAETLDADGLIVYGDVLVEPVENDQEKVSITWQVRWADGRELGVVSQANIVPRGATRAWEPVAPVVAANAADGIARLVREGVDAAPAEP